MDIWYFSEIPYTDLPDEESYSSTRVSLPNRYCDPKVASDIYRMRLDEWALADELGLNVMTNEHHQTPTCLVPSGPIIAGILARITSKGRILILGNPLAIRRDPLRVAEEMAMIDNISGGRLDVGFVRGVPYEVAAANVSPMELNGRMEEAHDLIIQAWTGHDEPFNFEGKYFQYRNVNIWPRPLQQPTPPVWLSTGTAFGSAKNGERGINTATFITGYDGTKEIFDAYRSGFEKRGTSEDVVTKLAYLGLVVVADSDTKALQLAHELAWYLRTDKVGWQYRNVPGYMPDFIASRVMHQHKRRNTRSLESWIEDGIIFAGTPDTVYNQIERFTKHVGKFKNLLVLGQSGGMEHNDVKQSIKLLATEVAPRLKELS